ncbi:MAG: hypothetical protein LRZ88_05020 [Candidatus Cloacimonetes bacterium]|nr:hypothetical protein [Candidatus Cloacimonadota bacterium]
MKTYHIESLGCAKNQVDSERFVAIMESYGMKEVYDPQDSDLILVNTCAFLRSAMEELDSVLSAILELIDLKKDQGGSYWLHYDQSSG